MLTSTFGIDIFWLAMIPFAILALGVMIGNAATGR